MDFRDKFGEERVIDVHYADLMRRPIETMRQLYRALGDDYTAEAEASMASWINDNPQAKFGRHEYKLAQYGLTPEQLRPMSAPTGKPPATASLSPPRSHPRHAPP